MAAILGVLRGAEDEAEADGSQGAERSDAPPAAVDQPPTAAG
jgi:hypothetical protein